MSVNAGGNVNVIAKSEVSYSGTVGGLAAGLVGVGGSVEVANIQGNTQAYIDAGSTVSAGGGVIVNADLANDTSSGTAFAGTAGIVGIGAQVVDIQDTSTESAALNSGVMIPQAQQVQITATSNRMLEAQAIGGDVGGLAAGVGVAIASATGGPTATIGSSTLIGQSETETVGSVDVAATSNDTVKATSYGVSAGLGIAATGVYANAVSAPSVTATVGNNAVIGTTGRVDVTAQDTPNADAQAFGVAASGGVSVGVVISDAESAGTTSSTLGNAVSIAALSILVQAERSQDSLGDPTAESSATAGSGGRWWGPRPPSARPRATARSRPKSARCWAAPTMTSSWGTNSRTARPQTAKSRSRRRTRAISPQVPPAFRSEACCARLRQCNVQLRRDDPGRAWFGSDDEHRGHARSLGDRDRPK